MASDAAPSILDLPFECFVQILENIPPMEALRTLSQVCSAFRDVLQSPEIWWRYCTQLSTFCTSSPWETMISAARKSQREQEPLQYFKSRIQGQNRLRKGELKEYLRLPCNGSIVRCALIDETNIVGLGQLDYINIWDWEGNIVAAIKPESMLRTPIVEIMCGQMSRDRLICGDNYVSIFDRETLKQTADIKSRGQATKEETGNMFFFTKVFKLFFDHKELAYSDGSGIEWRDLRDPNQVTQTAEAKTCSTFYWEPDQNEYFWSCYFAEPGGAEWGDSHKLLAKGDRRMPGIVTRYAGFGSWPSAIIVDSDRVICSDSRKSVLIFDRASGEKIDSLEGHSDWIVDIHMDDDVIITAGNDHQLRFWDRRTYEPTGVHGELSIGTGLCWAQWSEEHLVTCSESPDCNVYVYKY